MADLYANNYVTALAYAIDADDTSIVVRAAAPAALQGGDFRIVIGGELLLVTAGQDTTAWTVTRGIEGTTAAAHLGGAVVAHVLTAAGLAGLVSPPPIIDANAVPYLCTPGDAGHDNAAGITDAISAAFTYAIAHDGVGIVEFDPGEYWITGALRTDVGDAYAQIPLPHVAQTDAKVVIVLRSKVGNEMTFPGGFQTTAQPGLVLFHSTLTGQAHSVAYGIPSILGGPDPARAVSWSNVRLHTAGISFRQPSDPSLCCIQALLVNQLIVEDAGFDTEDALTAVAEPTNPTGIAVLVPGVNNNAWTEYRGSCFAMGYYAGFGLSESLRGGRVMAFQCYVGFNIEGDYHGGAHLDFADADGCPYVFATVDPASGISAPIAAASGYCMMSIDFLSIEDASSGWAVPIYHVNDPTNHYFGRIRYHRNLAGVGTQSGPLTLNGGANLTFDDLTLPPVVDVASLLAAGVRFWYGKTVLALSPIAYWRLGEAGGVTAVDEMGTYDGTYVGSPTLGTTGLLAADSNTAMTGTGSAVVTVPALPALAAWSIAYWHAGGAVTTAEVLLSSDADGFDVRQSGSAQWQYYTPGSGWAGVGVDSDAGGAAYAWTYDGTMVTLYKNGTSVWSGALSAGIGSVAWYLGAGAANGAGGINGVLDEAAIWDRVLTPSEIAILYAAGSGQ